MSAARKSLRAFVCVSAALVACTDAPVPGPASPETRSGCLSDADCRGELTCLLGACTRGDTPPGVYSLRVVPPQNLKSVPIEVPNLRFEDGPLIAPERPLLVPDRVVLVGRALTTDTPPAEVAVKALAVLRASVSPEGQTLAGRAVTTPRGPRFTFGLPPCWPDFSGTCKDTTFTVRLTPDSALLPPAEFRDLVLRDNRPEEERPFTLPGPLEAPTLTGDVRLLDGTPLHDLTVFGVDADGQRVTTESVTGLDGAFAVRYWGYQAGHDIRLLATSRDPMRPLPRLGLDVLLPAEGEATAPAHMVVPDIGATFTATGRLATLDGEPVTGAHLRFQTQSAAGPFTAHALTSADGGFAVTVYPGSYAVDIEPALGSGLRLQRTAIDIPAAGPAIDVRLKSLVPVRGRIVWPDGAPLADTRVLARLVSATAGRPEYEDTDDAAPPTRLVEGVTDADGVFTLLLDPGAQSLTVTPIAGLGLPTTRHAFRVPVESGLAVDLGDLPALAAGVVSVAIHDIRDVPIAGAAVQVWRTDLTDGPEKVAEGSTDPVGQVVLRVPDETE